jgi:hypothetical protein
MEAGSKCQETLGLLCRVIAVTIPDFLLRKTGAILNFKIYFIYMHTSPIKTTFIWALAISYPTLCAGKVGWLDQGPILSTIDILP